ncbi:MAG: hypothetical protein WBN94_08430 [Methanothrix sp.]
MGLDDLLRTFLERIFGKRLLGDEEHDRIARATMAGLQRLQINLAYGKWFDKQSSIMQTFLSIRRNEYAGRDDILGAIHLIERQHLNILSIGEDMLMITFGANRQLQRLDHLSLCPNTFRLLSEDLKCPQN